MGHKKRLVSNPPVSEVVQVSVSAVYQIKPTPMKRPSSTRMICHASLFRLVIAGFPYIYVHTKHTHIFKLFSSLHKPLQSRGPF